MLSCRDAARLLTRSLDLELPPFRRIGLRFHLMMCRLCRRHARQLRALDRIFRSLVAHPDEAVDLVPETLSPEARQRIGAALHDSDSG